MSARDELIGRLSADFEWQHIGAGTILLTSYAGTSLPLPARLELGSDKLFDRYLTSVADHSENGDRDAALGLILVHLEEAIDGALPEFGVRAVGIRRGLLGRPRWFSERVPADQFGDSPHTVWMADPPNG